MQLLVIIQEKTHVDVELIKSNHQLMELFAYLAGKYLYVVLGPVHCPEQNGDTTLS